MKPVRLIRYCFVLGLALSALAGCRSAPKQQAVVSNAEGPAIPAAVLQKGPTLADLTGGDLGIGGGFLIGAAADKISDQQRAEAVSAAQHAEQFPAQIENVRETKTADLNGDGFVTLDEVVAMMRAGLSLPEIADRLRATHCIFHVSPQQQRYLTDRGVTPEIISILHDLGKDSTTLKEN